MAEKLKISLPFHYEPRDYQLPFLKVFDNNINNGRGKIRKFVLVFHRRSGKDKTLINVVAKQMQLKVGAYYYMFPSYQQGKKIIWEGMDRDGFRFLDHFPKPLLAGKPNDTEMKLKYRNGSLFQIIGTDNIDSIVGTNPVGVVFSEYSLQDPRAWDYMRPILAENGGWAVFNYTPRGENHGKDLYDVACADKENYFCQLLTAEDTKAIPQEVLDQERAEIILQHGDDALFQQEYMCSFSAPIAGAYYAQQLLLAQKQGRICNVPYETRVPVDTYWDLGIDDSMTIWFCQVVGKEIRFIDYLEVTGEGIPYCVSELKNKGYVYGEHYWPHDGAVRELGTGVSRKETAESLGLRPLNINPRLHPDEGIAACRAIFNQCWFDAEKCKRGLLALKSYQKEYDERNKTYKSHPLHNWASHGADGFRTFGIGFNRAKTVSMKGGRTGRWTRDNSTYETEIRSY